MTPGGYRRRSRAARCRPAAGTSQLTAAGTGTAQWPAPMADPILLLAARLQPAFDAVAGAPGADPVVRPSDRADAQANGALPLAKVLGRTPRDIAEDVVGRADLDGVATVEIAGPGFLNLTLEASFIAALIAEVASDDALGIARATHPERVVVDYSAPNVAKEMHIGHLRTTAIGDALTRMLGAVGHDVVRENHIGDWGRPFGMLIEHLVDVGAERAQSLGLGDLDAFYKEANAKFDAGGDFQDRARRRVVLLQQRDPETIALWEALVAPERGPLERGVRQARRPPDRRRHRRREPVRRADARRARAPAPMPVCSRSPTAPRSCSRPASSTARVSRCR